MTIPDSVLNLPDDSRMLDVIRRGLDGADDVRIAVSFTRCSGLGLLIDPLRDRAFLLGIVNGDHRQRHGGVLRTPTDLNLHARYLRPEIVRHFGVHYDPARHNTGMLWFGDDGVIITKIDTSGAKTQFQYMNQLLDAATFSWTSQNRMGTGNEAGRRVVEHESKGLRLHLFVQPKAHEPAFYLGTGRVKSAAGEGPMRVELTLTQSIPSDLVSELSRNVEEDGSAPDMA